MGQAKGHLILSNYCRASFKDNSELHTSPFSTDEPFGLGRFATDHSLTKAASRPLFARVRRYALQRDN